MLLTIPSHLENVDVHKHDGPFNYKTCNILLEKGKCFDRKKSVRITSIKCAHAIVKRDGEILMFLCYIIIS